VVKIRVLGLSKTPSCECHTAIFATGNNVNFKGDMVRRGLLIDLEALSARPELQVFKGDALAKARAERAKYVAAALTIARAYFAAGKPKVCGPFGSYGPWSDMVPSPLVWLGEPDPMLSVEEIRKEDEVLASIVEFFGLWLSYLKVDHPYTTARIIETAETDARQTNNFNTPDLKLFLLKVAASRTKSNEISSDRLGKWLHKISGRPVEMPGTNLLVQHRLVRGQDRTHVATFCLTIG
jgi:putative DNA primase/helicase